MLFEMGDWTSPAFACEILGSLSGGHMAELYLARLKNTEHLVAVKAVQNGTAAQSLLRREAQVLHGLRQEGIPEMYGYWEEEDKSYFIMSYHKGRNLEEYIRQKGCMQEEQVQQIAMELCRILAYLHSKRVAVIHNDLKPANVLLQESGQVILLDFGLAEHINASREKLYFQGTLGYAAPECWHREADNICPATDVFALGATLFYLLEGREPKACYGKFQLSEEICLQKDRWQPVINKCCALDIRKRYQSAAEVYEVIKKIYTTSAM